MATFEQKLEFGAAGEAAIAFQLKCWGVSLLPAYEKPPDSGKGPVLLTPFRDLIVPDFMGFPPKNNPIWIEAKHKTAFTWHRISGKWTTGIDFRHYTHYLAVEKITKCRTWLLFLHKGGQAKDSPPDSPSGLFGNTLAYLSQNENHRYPDKEPHKMVYWAKESLKTGEELAECLLRHRENWEDHF